MQNLNSFLICFTYENKIILAHVHVSLTPTYYNLSRGSNIMETAAVAAHPRNFRIIVTKNTKKLRHFKHNSKENLCGCNFKWKVSIEKISFVRGLELGN